MRLCALLMFAATIFASAQQLPEMLPTNAPTSDTERLIDFVMALRCEALPPPVVQRCKELIADSISSMALGAAEPQGKLIRDHIHALQLGNDGGPSTVFGAEFTAHPALAAFANGCQAQIHDVNDGPVTAEMLNNCAHPGRYVVPVALACSEAWKCSGRELISATAAGYEFGRRTQNLPLQLRDLYVATVVAGKLAGLTASQLSEALVLCAYNAPGRQGHIRPEADEYWLTCGNICRSSVEGVLLVKAGARSFDLRRLKTQPWTVDLAGLGQQWAMSEVYQKPYPVCRNIHISLDLVRSLAVENHLQAADIATINIAKANGLYVGYEYIQSGATRTRAQFDIHHCVACAIIAGEFDERHTGREWIDNSEVRELAKKVTLSPIVLTGKQTNAVDAFNETEVVITTKDGRKYCAKTRAAWGDPAKPFSAEDRRHFFAARLNHVLPAEQTEQLYEFIQHLDNCESLWDVSWLLSMPTKHCKIHLIKTYTSKSSERRGQSIQKP